MAGQAGEPGQHGAEPIQQREDGFGLIVRRKPEKLNSFESSGRFGCLSASAAEPSDPVST
ncbi:MAG TPA: hypothetical protein VHM31_17320 [Polyangia bacterium]|nr:hypothetical protein [Polyangia bacterium]